MACKVVIGESISVTYVMYYGCRYLPDNDIDVIPDKMVWPDSLREM